MENEETESLELVSVQEVEADLIFSPALGGSQLMGYGSRKIIRQSIIDQLKPGYPIFQCECEEVTNEIVPSRCKKSTDWVLNVSKYVVYVLGKKLPQKLVCLSLPCVTCCMS